ncbi:MAG: nitrogenase-associated protein [Phycisphaerae bacterium]|nr:nitrogenase-associated protein [Phycisphaerae bacterium]
MAIITFYGKPNCVNNRKQRDRLIAAGHTVIVRDILQFPWTADLLHSFLKSRPFDAWFNRNAPAITSGWIEPEVLTDTEALNTMLELPILINRPLLEFDEYKLCGFDIEELDALIGLTPIQGGEHDIHAQFKKNMTVRPHGHTPDHHDTLEKKAS